MKQYQKDRLANDIYEFTLKRDDGDYRRMIWFKNYIAYLKPDKLKDIHKEMLSLKEKAKLEQIRQINLAD
jgi:hypothetical protein